MWDLSGYSTASENVSELTAAASQPLIAETSQADDFSESPSETDSEGESSDTSQSEKDIPVGKMGKIKKLLLSLGGLIGSANPEETNAKGRGKNSAAARKAIASKKAAALAAKKSASTNR
jgi:hypothetical protein